MIVLQHGSYSKNSTFKKTYADHRQRKRSLSIKTPLAAIHDLKMGGRRPNIPSSYTQVLMEWFHDNPEHLIRGNLVDLAWTLVRLTPVKLATLDMQPKEDDKRLNSWTSFNAAVYNTPHEITKIGYCPLIPGSSTDYNTIYTVLKMVQEMVRNLGQEDCVITFDLAIFMKAKEIQWRYAETFSDVVIRLGGFHIILNYMSLLGKKYQDCGLEDLLIESGLYGPATASSILKGKSYNHCIRAYRLLNEAMFQLQWEEFLELNPNILDPFLFQNLEAAKESYLRENDSTLLLQNIEGCVKTLHQSFEKFREDSGEKSHLFKFFDQLRDMLQIIDHFTRAERIGNWKYHLETVVKMIPYFFAFDRPNYSRWLPIYVGDMKSLDKSNPRVSQGLKEESIQ